MNSFQLQVALAALLTGRKRIFRDLENLLHDRSDSAGPGAARLQARLGDYVHELVERSPALPAPPWLNRSGGVAAMLDALRATCEHNQTEILTFFDPDYPPLLRQIPDPPALLYVRGARQLLVEPAVAIVGARRCTRLGASLAESFAERLAALGLTVISGLAYGIDAGAHRGALRAGATVAVLGGGLQRVQPLSNRPLAQQLVDQGGCLVSEYAPPVAAAKYQFPERNRIISGLALGVLVVEAGERSGSLITARLALEQGREVMAVPGTVGSGLSRGCHRLLRQGAALVEDVGDILAALGLVGSVTTTGRQNLTATPTGRPGSAVSPAMLSARHSALLERLADQPITLDEIVAAVRLPADEILALLVDLELDGFVQRTSAGYSRRLFSSKPDAWR